MEMRGDAGDEIHDDPDVALVGFPDEEVEVREGSVLGIDIAVIHDLITEVILGRGIDGIQPYGIDPQ